MKGVMENRAQLPVRSLMIIGLLFLRSLMNEFRIIGSNYDLSLQSQKHTKCIMYMIALSEHNYLDDASTCNYVIRTGNTKLR